VCVGNTRLSTRKKHLTSKCPPLQLTITTTETPKTTPPQVNVLATAFSRRSEEAAVGTGAHRTALGALALAGALEEGRPVNREQWVRGGWLQRFNASIGFGWIRGLGLRGLASIPLLTPTTPAQQIQQLTHRHPKPITKKPTTKPTTKPLGAGAWGGRRPRGGRRHLVTAGCSSHQGAPHARAAAGAV